jgi:predicted ATPase
VSISARSIDTIGRDAEIALAIELLGETPLLTLTCPGGIGKTRLALELARRLRDAPYEVLFCDLHGCNDGEDVVPTIARALGITSARPAVDPLVAALAEREALVVIDNAEQVADTLAARLGVWIERCPRTRWLVTSQWRLGITEERVLELGPLAQPDAERLWIARVRHGRPDYDIESEREPVEALIRALDAIPLAIELAAARRHLLTARAMTQRLEEDLEVLRSTAPDRIERHRTLERAIEWSYRLLTPWEQALLTQCSVFEPDFTLEAIEAVAVLGDDAPSVLEGIASLRDKSMVQLRDPTLLGWAEGTSRYALYTSVRAFAAARLVDREAVLARHAQWTTTNAAALVARMWRVEGTHREFEAELPNLRAVVTRALTDRGADVVMAARALACAIASVSMSQGSWPELLPLLTRFMDAHREAIPTDLRAEIGQAWGRLTYICGDLATAEKVLNEALVHAAPAAAPGILTFLARVLASNARADEARATLDRALTLAEANGDEEKIGIVLAMIGMEASERGATEESRRSLERALALYRSAQREGRAANLLNALALTHLDDGHLEQARALFIEGERVGERFGWSNAVEFARFGLASVALDEGAIDQAVELYERTAARFAAQGDARMEGFARGNLGLARRIRGDLEDAARELERAVIRLRHFGDPNAAAFYETARAAIQRERGGPVLETSNAASGVLEEVRVLHERRPQLTASEVCALAATPHVRELAARSFDARVAVRLLDDKAAAMRELVVARDLAWVRDPSGEQHELASRPLIQRLLRFLLDRRERAPGRGASVKEMLSAGWPGEKVTAEAGSSRVYVAIGTLKKLGLEDVIRGGRGGYFLDPDVRVRVAE